MFIILFTSRLGVAPLLAALVTNSWFGSSDLDHDTSGQYIDHYLFFNYLVATFPHGCFNRILGGNATTSLGNGNSHVSDSNVFLGWKDKRVASFIGRWSYSSLSLVIAGPRLWLVRFFLRSLTWRLVRPFLFFLKHSRQNQLEPVCLF